MNGEHSLKQIRIYLGAIALIIVLGAFGAYWRTRVFTRDIPPPLTHIEDFTLVDQNGKSVSSKQLLGSTLVVNFIFTTCPDLCPLLTERMAKIQKLLGPNVPDVRLLSISVDPAHDTPEALKAFGQAHGADFSNWSFLTGPIDTLSRVIVDGFKISVQNSDFSRRQAAGAALPQSLMQITHGEHFVVVDALGQIRAYMTAQNDREIRRIVNLARLLTNTGQEILRTR